jgi:hypothetical protein
MTWINILFLLLITSCGTTVPSKKVCSIVKHRYDFLYQVQINKTPLSEQWFLYEDAMEISKDLLKKNQCQSIANDSRK